tara:strand:+ start:233 stop:631 length:399 start_codon:yes stop_codon:yes gene_type:complete
MSILSKIFSSGATDLVDSVGNVVDKLHTSAEEKEIAKREMVKLIEEYEHKMQVEVTKRWQSDMNSNNWLAKSIRPLSLAFLLLVLTVFTLVDFGYAYLEIKDSYIDLWQMLSLTAFGAYFGGRSYEKIRNGK